VTPSETYAIVGGRTGKSRLDVLAEGMQASTLQLLERVGVPAGGACLDVGCGGGHVTLELARLAGPSGLAVGVDFDSDVLALAEEDAARLGVTNVLFRCGDALGLASAVGDFDFDVVYCRFLLSHVVSPGDVVREMADPVRPGGAVAVEDIDYRGSLCEPPSESFQRTTSCTNQSFDCGAPTPRSGPAFQVCSMTPGWWMSTSPAFNSSGAIHNRLSNGSTS
jgi:2-polyprenyl-3-methyl-5-hydroxy-6-metoxy-1,4-benzoquinol methylase